LIPPRSGGATPLRPIRARDEGLSMTLSDFLSRFALVFAVWIALHAYAWRRLATPLSLRPALRLPLLLLCVAGAVLAPATFALERFRVDAAWRPAATYGGFLAMGLSSSLLLLLLVRDSLLVPGRLMRRIFGGKRAVSRRSRIASPEPERPAAPPAAPAVDVGRRSFLRRASDASVTVVATAGFGAGFVGGRREPRLVDLEIPCDDLPPALDGFRIAQLSDVHIGPMQDGDFLRRAVARVNAAGVDLVAVTGDLVDGYVADLREAVASLRELRSRHGSWFVTGNHEFYWDARAWCDELRRLGVRVLENEHAVLDHLGARLVIGGVHDFSAGRIDPNFATDPHGAFRGAPEDGFRLLLAHQPKSVYQGAAAGARLQLSGHTHGGQYFPFTYLIRFVQPFVAGLYEYRSEATEAQCSLFVHRGTGSWGPPLRLGSPAEIVILTLRARR
jgi:predicted MPP superfamily phosphohydrolase